MIKNINLSVKKMFCRILVIALLAVTILKPTPAIAGVRLNTNTPQSSAPTVTINQRSIQADPTTTSLVVFIVTFSEPVTGFTGISLAGSTVGGTLTTRVYGSGASYDAIYEVSVTGMSGSGTVVASIPAGAAFNADGNPNFASTSEDNTITYFVAPVGTLDTNNPSAGGFVKEGNQSVIASTALGLNDGSGADHVGLFAEDPSAATGADVDVVATFRVLNNTTPSGVDTGVRIIITDGVTTSAVAACVTLGGLPGIAIAVGNDFASPANYAAFVPVDWLAPVNLMLRRWADGGAEIIEVNGVAPASRIVVPVTALPGPVRSMPSVGFGLFSDPAVTTAEFNQFSSHVVSEAVIPVNGIPPTLTPVTINAGSGDQNDPHISGDLVAYASDFSLRYYSFLTNTDAQIPLGPSARDLLSDVSGSKIVFSRVLAGGNTTVALVMVFDAAMPASPPVEIDVADGTTRLGSAIGGDTIAYIDFGLQGNGELVIHDLASSASLRITNDTNTDQNPAVSPDGNVVTWEHCLSSAGNCDIWQAVKSGTVWNVSVVSNTTNSEANPDTNGTIIVYDSRRPTNGDLFWHPVDGGEEVQLLLSGFEANPSIAGNLIAFESRPTQAGTTDIFVYDITTNLLYQITDTPLVSEQLNDITVLPDCRIRVVWASDEDGASERNIKAATFSLNACNDDTPPVLDSIADVIVTLPLNSTATSTTVAFPIPTATDDSGSVTVMTTPASGAVFPIGRTTVDVTATDDAGNSVTGSFTVTVLHNFFGFLQPVENLPILNVINAGQAVPVKFSLSGNKGLNILAAGYPISGQIACDANEPGSVIEETVTAGGSSLSYDAAADRYSYVWKTDKAWKGTCRILALRLKDGSNHFAKFRFR
jgi:HYR domain-containing protein/WD40 repeat protein